MLQTASVIGKTFSEPVLKRVGEFPETELAEALRALIEAEFLYEEASIRRPSTPSSTR